ncbi:cuticle protein 18.7-like [Phymastichus coffea]|uniref:cuticle protein 18.7-like n=1 Tax=Phymastichus coffea TaxID=108790 RepID=UPI00273A7BFA|nr:cuticle protein 18.7-like [Phymastichus coffea]
MKTLVVLFCVVAVAFAKPGFLVTPLAYSAIFPGAPLGTDGRVVDTPEVSLAKAEHAAAHVNERLNRNQELLRSANFIAPAVLPAAAVPAAIPLAAAPAALRIATPLTYNSILAADGRPLDTAEVALAKASHAAAHLNERIIHANEFSRNLEYAYDRYY